MGEFWVIRTCFGALFVVGTTMTPVIVAIVLTLQVSTEPMCLVTVVTAVSVPENKNPWKNSVTVFWGDRLLYIVLLYICTYAIYIYLYTYLYVYIYMIYALKRSLSHGNQQKRFYDLEEPSLLAGSVSRLAFLSLLKNYTVDRLGEKKA